MITSKSIFLLSTFLTYIAIHLHPLYMEFLSLIWFNTQGHAIRMEQFIKRDNLLTNNWQNKIMGSLDWSRHFVIFIMVDTTTLSAKKKKSSTKSNGDVFKTIVMTLLITDSDLSMDFSVFPSTTKSTLRVWSESKGCSFLQSFYFYRGLFCSWSCFFWTSGFEHCSLSPHFISV